MPMRNQKSYFPIEIHILIILAYKSKLKIKLPLGAPYPDVGHESVPARSDSHQPLPLRWICSQFEHSIHSLGPFPFVPNSPTLLLKGAFCLGCKAETDLDALLSTYRLNCRGVWASACIQTRECNAQSNLSVEVGLIRSVVI